MRTQLTLEFWRDGDFYVGRLLEVPGVFSQGETLDELRENIQDAFDLMVTQERSPAPAVAQREQVEMEVGNVRHSSKNSNGQAAHSFVTARDMMLTVYRNLANGQQAPVPRHLEIAATLCEVIRKQLGLTN